ncbi:MAG: hypothetical protein ACQESP_12690 [Candidatus Muiribacteriota bacterium]
MIKKHNKESYFSSCLNNINPDVALKMTDTFDFILDGRAYFIKKIKKLVKLFNQKGNCMDEDEVHNILNELSFLYKNENRLSQNEKDILTLNLLKFLLHKGHHLKAYEVLSIIRTPFFKFQAYTLYGIKLWQKCGKSFGEIYFDKAKKIISEDENIQKQLISSNLFKA